LAPMPQTKLQLQKYIKHKVAQLIIRLSFTSHQSMPSTNGRKTSANTQSTWPAISGPAQ